MDDTDKQQRTVIFVVGALVAVVALVVGILIATGGDDDDGPATTTSTSSSSSTSSSLAPSTTTTVLAADLDLAAYPALIRGDRFEDPRALVTAFATDILGFDTDVVVGQLQQGDARSGEIVVTPSSTTATTTVAVRQISDDSWVVVAASTDSIRLDTPIARTRIASAQPLIGAATAFEGHVDVALYADGEPTPIATSFVTGRGDGQLGDFDGSLKFDAPEGVTHGVLVLSAANGEDGTTNAATAIRVRF